MIKVELVVVIVDGLYSPVTRLSSNVLVIFLSIIEMELLYCIQATRLIIEIIEVPILETAEVVILFAVGRIVALLRGMTAARLQ